MLWHSDGIDSELLLSSQIPCSARGRALERPSAPPASTTHSTTALSTQACVHRAPHTHQLRALKPMSFFGRGAY